jgi:hypothetical protein
VLGLLLLSTPSSEAAVLKHIRQRMRLRKQERTELARFNAHNDTHLNREEFREYRAKMQRQKEQTALRQQMRGLEDLLSEMADPRRPFRVADAMNRLVDQIRLAKASGGALSDLRGIARAAAYSGRFLGGDSGPWGWGARSTVYVAARERALSNLHWLEEFGEGRAN